MGCLGDAIGSQRASCPLQRGYKMLACKMVKPSESLLKEHYGDLSSKPFFPKLIAYMVRTNGERVE